MILALWSLAAWADPVALRAPLAAPGGTAGSHDISVAAGVGEGRWVAAEMGTDLASVGASAGTRWAFGGESSPRVLQAGLAAGLLLPTIQPGIALTGTPWVHGGWVGRTGTFVAGAAMPLAVGTGGVRVPLLFELQGGVHVGPVWVGGRLSAGPVFTAGLDMAVLAQPSVLIQLER